MWRYHHGWLRSLPTCPATHVHFPTFTNSERGSRSLSPERGRARSCPLSLHPLDAQPSWGPECLRPSAVQSPLTGVCKHLWAGCSAQPGSSRLRAPCPAGADGPTAAFPLRAGKSQCQPPGHPPPSLPSAIFSASVSKSTSGRSNNEAGPLRVQEDPRPGAGHTAGTRTRTRTRTEGVSHACSLLQMDGRNRHQLRRTSQDWRKLILCLFLLVLRKASRAAVRTLLQTRGLYVLQGPGRAGSLFFGWENYVSKSPAQVAEAHSESHHGALGRVCGRPGKGCSPFLQRPCESEGVTCSLPPRGACSQRRRGPCSRGTPGRPPHLSQDTPGRSPPGPTSHTRRPTLHLGASPGKFQASAPESVPKGRAGGSGGA